MASSGKTGNDDTMSSSPREYTQLEPVLSGDEDIVSSFSAVDGEMSDGNLTF